MHEGVATEIVKLASQAEVVTQDGLLYTLTKDHDKTVVTLLAPPQPSILPVHTLLGLTTLTAAGFEGATHASHVLHVSDEQTVRLIQRGSNTYGQRTTVVEAKALKGSVEFQYGNFYDQESFIIKLQAFFLPDFDRQYVLTTVANLASQDKLQVEDNGITQGVTLQANVAFASNVELKPRVTLAPYRTFRDVNQPSSDFILRVKKDERTGKPSVALFEADGGEWKLEAIKRVCAFLNRELNGTPNAESVKADDAAWVISA